MIRLHRDSQWTARQLGSVGIALLFLALGPALLAQAPGLPSRLSDTEFWALEQDISEPGGYFQITDNYTSNEAEVGELFTMLRDTGVQGGVYLGVGPEQNLSYIAAIHPAMAFICDIRRQAVMQHLMFKAMFELSRDRADFISILFSKPRPDGIDDKTPIQQIWRAYAQVATSAEAITSNAARVTERLTKTHGFAFTPDESAQLAGVLDAFASIGPQISTRGGPGGRGGGNGGTFMDLTGWSTDASGAPQSFLSTEENFQYVKMLHEKNLIVPVSGDFGGPKAIRAIGAYLKKQGGTVSAFYVSNVEQYLFQDRKDRAFYDNVATLPTTDKTVFIRPYSLRQRQTSSIGSVERSLCRINEFLAAAGQGRVQNNNDALACGR
jgi:hypothetical protein